MLTSSAEERKKMLQMDGDQFSPTSHCVMDVTFISALSTNAFGFILHLRFFNSPFSFMAS